MTLLINVTSLYLLLMIFKIIYYYKVQYL